MKKNFKSQISNLKSLKLLIFCISILLASQFSLLTSLFAEEKTTTLEEIVVTAARIEEAIEETTSDVIVIKEKDIKNMNVEFVTDVLRKVSDLNLVQNGGAGKLATVLLRGGSSEHTLVMTDGIKVNSTTTGSFDFSGISVDDIERIEIVKGPQSTIYGSEAMAGVINIITKKGKGKPKIDASFQSGSYGTYKPSMTVSGGDKKLDYRLTGTYFYTDGISAAKQGSERDGYKNASVSGKFGFRPVEKVELELLGRYYYDRSGLDAFGKDDPNYVQRGNHYVISGKGKIYILDKWEQIFTLSTVWDSLKYRDPDTAWYNSDIITGIHTVDWQHNLYLTDSYTLTAGAEYRKEKGENVSSFNRSVDDKAFYLNNKLKLFGENLVFNAGLRYDDHETFGNKTTYRIGAIYSINPIAVRIKSSYGTGFRAPTLNDLFYTDPWGSRGNPDLKPEESNSWEMGIEKDIIKDRASVSVTYFIQDYKNLIEWVEIAPWVYMPQNVAKAGVKGVETDARLRLTEDLNIKIGYTYLDTEDKTTGKRLPRRPKDKFNLSAEFSTKDISVIADYIFVGKRLDLSGGMDLSSYSLVNLGTNYRVTKGMTLFARIENLFDADYEEGGGYGTAGLSLFGGIKISL